MSIDIKPDLTTESPAAEVKKKHRIPKKAWGYIAVGVICAVVGTSMGTTEYVEVEKPVEVVKEVEVEVPSGTPVACLDFMSAADDIHEITTDAMDLVSENVTNAANRDVAAMGANNDALNAITENKLKPAMERYRQLKIECANG